MISRNKLTIDDFFQDVCDSIEQWRIETQNKRLFEFNSRKDKISNSLISYTNALKSINEVDQILNAVINMSQIEFLRTFDYEYLNQSIWSINCSKFHKDKYEKLNKLEICKELCSKLTILAEDKIDQWNNKLFEQPLISNRSKHQKAILSASANKSSSKWFKKPTNSNRDNKRSFVWVNKDFSSPNLKNINNDFGQNIKLGYQNHKTEENVYGSLATSANTKFRKER